MILIPQTELMVHAITPPPTFDTDPIDGDQTITPPPTDGDIHIRDLGDEIDPYLDALETAPCSFGNLAQITDDYFSVSIEQPNQAYINAEIDAVGLIDFEKVGRVDQGNGQYLERYKATIQLTPVVYASYPLQYYFSLELEPYIIKNPTGTIIVQEELQWVRFLTVVHEDLHIEYDRDSYYFQYATYDHSLVHTQNGGVFDLDISVGFHIPWSGQTIGNYQIESVIPYVLSLETTQAATTGIISKTDSHFSKNSGTSTVITAISSSDDPDPDVERVAEAIEDKPIGYHSEYDFAYVTDSSMLTLGMGVNSRLAEKTPDTATDTLTGTYHCQVGARASHMVSTIEYGSMTIFSDSRGLFQGIDISQYTQKATLQRCGALEVVNYYVYQPIRCEVDLLTTIQDLTWEETPDEQLIVDPPSGEEDIEYNNYTGGDEEVGIEVPESPINWKNVRNWGIGIAIGVIFIFIIYLKGKQMVIRTFTRGAFNAGNG